MADRDRQTRPNALPRRTERVVITRKHNVDRHQSVQIDLIHCYGCYRDVANRSCWHTSPHLWNKLPVSLRHGQPCLNQSSSPSLSPLSSSITPSLFHSKLKRIFSNFSTTDTHTHQPDWLHRLLHFSLAQWFFFLLLISFIFSLQCHAVD